MSSSMPSSEFTAVGEEEVEDGGGEEIRLLKDNPKEKGGGTRRGEGDLGVGS
jgi:hypothetical protein